MMRIRSNAIASTARDGLSQLLRKAGFHCEYDIMDPAVPQCRMIVYLIERR